jgi:hypothetical protein
MMSYSSTAVAAANGNCSAIAYWLSQIVPENRLFMGAGGHYVISHIDEKRKKALFIVSFFTRKKDNPE